MAEWKMPTIRLPAARAWARWHRPLTTGIRATVSLLLPCCCNFCGRTFQQNPSAHLLCDACVAELVLDDRDVCLTCGNPLSPGAAATDCCLRCRDRHYAFQAARGLGLYRGAMQEAVLRMKKVDDEPLTLSIGKLLGQQLRPWCEAAGSELVVPIPTHWTRQWTRGTSSPAVLAEAASRVWGLPMASDLLRCRRKTRKQGTLTPTERFPNVRHAFAVSAGYDIGGARLMLIDDILTTGATASEAARALRRAGARRVHVAVAARGVGIG